MKNIVSIYVFLLLASAFSSFGLLVAGFEKTKIAKCFFLLALLLAALGVCALSVLFVKYVWYLRI